MKMALEIITRNPESIEAEIDRIEGAMDLLSTFCNEFDLPYPDLKQCLETAVSILTTKEDELNHLLEISLEAEDYD